MSKTILVCGYGPGISQAVANKFGSEGFHVALAARSAEKLELAVAQLNARGIQAAAFPTDLSDPVQVVELVAKAHAWSPLSVMHWNAYPSAGADLTKVTVAEMRNSLDLGVTSLIAAVQAILPDLRSQKDPAVLVTGGGLALHDPKVDKMAVAWGTMGLSIVKSAQHKLVGLLNAQLGAQGIYVGEVMVRGVVKGTAFDDGNGTIEASSVAEQFWKLYSERNEMWVSAF